jgi:hypothetical protein
MLRCCCVKLTIEPDTATIAVSPKEAADQKKSLAHYPINLLLIAAMQNVGRAGKAASTLLGALGLADAAFYCSWQKTEDVLGLAKLEVAK